MIYQTYLTVSLRDTLRNLSSIAEQMENKVKRYIQVSFWWSPRWSLKSDLWNFHFKYIHHMNWVRIIEKDSDFLDSRVPLDDRSIPNTCNKLDRFEKDELTRRTLSLLGCVFERYTIFKPFRVLQHSSTILQAFKVIS